MAIAIPWELPYEEIWPDWLQCPIKTRPLSEGGPYGSRKLNSNKDLWAKRPRPRRLTSYTGEGRGWR
eukprot:3698430-Pyramimonas_sp.AAC.1